MMTTLSSCWVVVFCSTLLSPQLFQTVASSDADSDAKLTVRGLGVDQWKMSSGRFPARFRRDQFQTNCRSSWAGIKNAHLRQSPEEPFHAVVIDAGSSGSRVRVYRWTSSIDVHGGADNEESPSTLMLALDAQLIEQIFTTKIDIGLSSRATHDEVEADVYRLLSSAAPHVPANLRNMTPAYVMATAGLRQLDEDKMAKIVRLIDRKMRNESFNPFQYRSSHHTRILSGEEEGVFAWISVNYLVGGLKSDKSVVDTVGVLEMGGQSTQIAFIPAGNVLASKFPVHIGGCRYPLYVHSYLRFGQNAIETKVRERLSRDNKNAPSPSNVNISNPCMVQGDVQTDLNKTFVGTGDPWQCRLLLEEFLKRADKNLCHQPPCAIGAAYQPTIPANKTFFAVGSFHFSLKAIGALSPDGVYVPQVGYEKAAEFCRKPLSQLYHEADSVGRPRKYVPSTCVVALYTAVLFNRAYNFNNITEQIKVVDKLNNQPLDWALGALLYEDEIDAMRTCKQNRGNFRNGAVSTAVRFDAVHSVTSPAPVLVPQFIVSIAAVAIAMSLTRSLSRSSMLMTSSSTWWWWR